MELEQYVGCLIRYNGRVALVTGTRSNYDGDWFYLKFTDRETTFSVNAFERDLMQALPSPEFGLLKRREKGVVFLYKGIEYELTDQPQEPCLYLKKDGRIIRTLHNAFTAFDLPEWFAEGRTLTAVNGKVYDATAFCKVLAAAIDSNRSEMDFPFAASLVK